MKKLVLSYFNQLLSQAPGKKGLTGAKSTWACHINMFGQAESYNPEIQSKNGKTMRGEKAVKPVPKEVHLGKMKAGPKGQLT